MRTELRTARAVFASILLSGLIVSCDTNPNFIGRELLPSADNFSVSFDSVEVVNGYTTRIDSIRSTYKTTQLLGSIIDPFFGKSRAEIVTTISSTAFSEAFGPNAVADSVLLSISWMDQTGRGQLPILIYLYEYTEFMRNDTTYYTNKDMTGKYRENELGSVPIPPDDTIARIHITDQEFIDKFLTADDSVLISSNYLQQLVDGLYLKTGDAIDGGKLLHINFDYAGNGLYFYYSNDSSSSLSQYYSLENSYNGRINIFRHNTTGYPLGQYLQNGAGNDSIIFVQSMAGVSSVIRFPELDSWLDSMPVAINEARLTFTVVDTLFTMQHKKYFPESLDLFAMHEDGSVTRLYDYVLDPTAFSGDYDEDSQTYSFSIKVHLQSILTGDINNLPLLLTVGNTAETNTRAVLYGSVPGDKSKNIKLEIIYTLL